jgi:hypothetical protein
MASLSHEEFAMKRFGLVGLVAVLAAVVSMLSPVQAQNYVSPSGTGSACTPSVPCTLQEAIILSDDFTNQTAICNDGGNAFISPITITNSFAIDCRGGFVSSTSGVALTLTGTSAQVVKLRNLTFTRYIGGINQPFISVTGGTTLIIENCRFEDEGASNAVGGTPIAIQFLPTSPAAQLIIRDTVFANNGIAPGTGGGIQVAPSAGGSASVKLERVSFDFNVTSMVLSGPVDATMINSTVSASRSNGILVGSGATLDVVDSTFADNVGSAISVSAGGTVRLSNSNIKSNQIGISNSGGQALSYRNNHIVGNGSTATLGTITGGQ